MRVYLSGGMSGYPWYNEGMFDVAEALATARGWEVVNPAAKDRKQGIVMDPLGRPLDRGKYEEVLAGDFGDIESCEAIWLLPHWHESEGANRELEHAYKYTLAVYDFTEGELVPDLTQLDRQELAVNEPSRRIGDFSHEPAVRLTHSNGASKGMRITRYDMIPPEALAEVAAVYGYGELKYPSGVDGPNWLRGMPYSWNLRAMMQHIEEFRQGINFDEEDGVSPLAHAIWHALALLTYQARDIGIDDRSYLR